MKLSIKEIAVFAMMGSLMCAADVFMDFLPNVHFVAVLIVISTVLFRAKALWIIYTYIFILGIISGFSLWWIPYLYIWTLLWLAVMLLPRNMPRKVAIVAYITVCGLHGYLFGILYAPAQMLLFGFSFKQICAWVIAGIPFDLIHGTSNLISGLLIYPAVSALKKVIK